ncbi:MAG: acetolactate synthase small subunit [Clostridia bacterium]|nr:acetolactate synthase small subunit [Clostridia bacterium]
MKDNRTVTVLSVLAYNNPAVLLRMTGLFYRRGFNIETMVACQTDRPSLSRLTVTMTGQSAEIKQVRRQLLKLEDIVKVDVLEMADCAASSLALIKVSATPENRHAVLSAAQTYGCRVLDIGDTTITLEMTGREEEVNRFVEFMRPFNIVEMGCTGVTALQRGDTTIFDGLEG